MLSVVLLACGDNIATIDAPQVAPPFEPAAHTPLPQISGHSNTVLSSVRLVTLTFADDPARAQLDQLGALIVQSAWYQGVGAEYGVGAGVAWAQVHLGPAPPSLTPVQAADVIQQAVAQELAPAPASRADQLLYLLHVPASVAHPAIAAPGFHTTVIVNHVTVPLAVAIDGAAPTETAARLLIDAATDPYNPPDDGFYADPPATDPWSLVPGEVADLCDAEPAVALDDDHPTLTVPRVYSNAAASSGKPPCRPATDGDLWTSVSADPGRIVKAARGALVSFRLTGWSTRQTDDWTLQLESVAGSSLTLTELSPELGPTTINNGGRATLTLQVPSNADLSETGAIYVRSGPTGHPWVVGVIVE